MSPGVSSSQGFSGAGPQISDSLHVVHMSARRTIAAFLIGALLGGLAGAISAPVAMRLGDNPAMCTLVGGESQILATVSDQYADMTKPLKLVITMGGVVYTVESPSAEIPSMTGRGNIAFPLPDRMELAPVNVALHFTDREGQQKIASYDGLLEEFTPNGPNCPPQLVGLNLSVDADGRLVPIRDTARANQSSSAAAPPHPQSNGAAVLATPGGANTDTSDTIACTEIGADSGISVLLPGAERQHGSAVRLDVQIDGQTYTAEQSSFTQDAQTKDLLALAQIPEGLPKDTNATITLSYVDATGTPQRLTYQGPLEEYSPNGPRCDPHVLVLSMVVHEAKLLTYEAWAAAYPDLLKVTETADHVIVRNSPPGQ